MIFDIEDFLEKTHDFGPEIQRKILVEKRLALAGCMQVIKEILITKARK